MWTRGLLCASLLLAACGGEEAAPASAPSWTVSVAPVLAGYESLREALAADRLSIAAEANALASAADGAATQVPADASPQLTALADAARALAAVDASDGDAVRTAFGEVSRHLAALLNRHAALRTGLHIFECPMAQGFQRWIQPSAEMANPYMGTRMLQCGREVEF